MVKTGRPALELGAGVVENWKISREIGRFQGTLEDFKEPPGGKGAYCQNVMISTDGSSACPNFWSAMKSCS